MQNKSDAPQENKENVEEKKPKYSSRDRDMYRDETFIAFFERCKPNSMTTMPRLYNVYTSVQYIIQNNIPGSLVECGVWRGGSMMMAALTLLDVVGNTERDLFLFDTYTGMPEPDAVDTKFEGLSAQEKYEEKVSDGYTDWNYASLEEVQQVLYETGYPREKLHFVKGMVEDTLPHPAIKQVALLRLDTDFYRSTKHELEHLYPLMSSGGVLIIDDYGTWKGSKKATDEYLASQPRQIFLQRIDTAARVGIKP